MSDPVEGLRLERVARRFGATWALRDVSFLVAPGALCVLVGPSGCGKTTLLRAIAGFEPPDAGAVLLDGLDLTRVPPERRGASMVFQHFALFPQMTVADNVGYGPRVRGEDTSIRDAAVREMLELVGLPALGGRRPHELSGGQQQRVAVARALAARPRLLLLDEPLSNVDPAQRRETRDRLRALHAERHLTTLWVTHDRDEALAVADQVVLLRAGEVAQTGTPRDLCERPASAFVAEFLLDATILEPLAARMALGAETTGAVAVRPDRVGLACAEDGPLRVETVAYGPVRTEVVAAMTLPASGETVRVRAQIETDHVPAGLVVGSAVRAITRDGALLRFAR